MPSQPSEETQVAKRINGQDNNHEGSPLLAVTHNDANESQEATLNKARRVLYVSHLFSQFSEVLWQFCLILFLAAFTNYQSLVLVSSYGLISNGSVCVFGAKAGRFVDGANRLLAARRFILSENGCVIAASIFCYLLLERTLDGINMDETMNDGSWLATRLNGIPLDILSIILLFGIHLLGAAAMILDKGFLVAMERDWIVVMSQYAADESHPSIQASAVTNPASKKWLAETNVAMKQIDLSCKVAAPAAAGFLLTFFDDGSDAHHGKHLRWAAILVGGINAAALVVEYICTAQIYHMLPALAMQKVHNNGKEVAPNGESGASTKTTTSSKLFRMLPSSMQVYMAQPIAYGGISLSLLYLNVLTFGGIMTAYLVWRGMKLDAIGVWRGLSSAVGLMGTVAYHQSSKRTYLVNTGMWSITYQFVCLSMSYVSLFIANYNLSMSLLIFGVCSSRIGLWVFDISINQLMQEHVPDGIRGVVGGVQQSLNSFFFLLSFALGLVFPDPKDFYIYVAAGYASVGIALALYGFCIFAKKDIFLTDT